GIPHPYDKTKTEVIHDALKVLRLQKRPKFCLLGRLSSELNRQCDLNCVWDWFLGMAGTGGEEEEREGTFVVKRRKQLRVKAEKVAKENLGSQIDILAQVNRAGLNLPLANSKSFQSQSHRLPMVVQSPMNYPLLMSGTPFRNLNLLLFFRSLSTM
ncbi:hypothetical protein PIB30_106531, partial [Stylosanthes scabra]|nr:hypothetical protein [Stylosanthes scabra]